MSDNKKDKVKANSERFRSDQNLRLILERDLAENINNIVTKSFELRRDFLVSELASCLTEVSRMSVGASLKAEWVSIDSLSRLRRVVGGRFQNIKKMWIGCGFPMAGESKAKIEDSSVDMRGWSAMSSWIIKSGFEVRLSKQEDPGYFEIRQIPSSSSSN